MESWDFNDVSILNLGNVIFILLLYLHPLEVSPIQTIDTNDYLRIHWHAQLGIWKRLLLGCRHHRVWGPDSASSSSEDP
jgi:hypothetical protein